MPELGAYNLQDLDQLHKLAQEEYNVRQLAIQRRLKYYEGDHKKWMIDPVSRKPTAENVTINVTRKIIDQSVSFLMGQPPVIETGDDSIDAQIEIITDANKDDLFYTVLGESGAVSGHNFIKIIPDPEYPGGIRWVMQDPELVSVFWSPSDGQTPIAYKIEWKSGRTDYRQDIVKMGVVTDGGEMNPTAESWLILDMKREGSGNWELTSQQTWQYPFAPIVDWQNLPDYTSYYGLSDISALDLNDSINFTASNINRILKYHAHPKTIATGVKKEDIQQTSVNGMWSIENENAKIYNLEMQSDLESSMAYLMYLQGEFYTQQRAVDITTIKDRLGQLTNFGIRVLFGDALAKNSTKQMLYGYGLKELVYRSLYILGMQIPADSIDVKFADPLPVNTIEVAQQVKVELESGTISKQTGSETLGHDWEVEQERMSAEKQESAGDIGQQLADAVRRFDTINADEAANG